MSVWTHIQGVFHIDLLNGYEDKVMLEMTTRILLEKAPRITGSEGGMDIYINAENGYNSTETISHLDKCGEVHYRTINKQSGVIVTIIGDLRDRKAQEINEKYQIFEAYIKSLNVLIRDYIVQIYDELGDSIVIKSKLGDE